MFARITGFGQPFSLIFGRLIFFDLKNNKVIFSTSSFDPLIFCFRIFYRSNWNLIEHLLTSLF